MAKVGLDKIYIAVVTKNDETAYTTDTPEQLSGGITVDIEPTVNESKLYADNMLYASETAVSEIKLTMELADLTTAQQAKLLGATAQSDGTLLFTANDKPKEIALGFRANTSDGGYEYVWLFSGKFSLPKESNKTKGDNIEYTTPSMEGTFGQRKKDAAWKIAVRSKDENLGANVISGWFSAVPAVLGAGE